MHACDTIIKSRKGVNDMEMLIKTVAADVFQVEKEEVIIESRLMGGMSNYMYVINIKGERYTFRIPGEKSETFVNREDEYLNIDRIKPLGINNETVYFDIETGYKIARYVEGVPLSELENPIEKLEEVAVILKTLHESNIEACKDYQPYERLQAYEAAASRVGHDCLPAYQTLKAEFLTYRPLLDAVKKVFCHNDSQISNILLSKKQVYLLDWEFGGQNDPLYDVACVGNKDFNLALAFLPVYLGREATNEEYQRLYVWRAFQCLQWHNVAAFKHRIGLSEKLNVNFEVVSLMYIDKADQFLKEAKKY